MAKRKIDQPEPGEQLMLIDTTDPAHKPLIKAIKKWKSLTAERSELLNASKENCEAAHDNVVSLMTDLGLASKGFIYDGYEYELGAGKQKVVTRKHKADENGDGDDSGYDGDEGGSGA